MAKGYDFDIVRVGDRIEYDHETLDEPIIGAVTSVTEGMGYDTVVTVDFESDDDDDTLDRFTVRMDAGNIGAEYYSVDLLDWER